MKVSAKAELPAEYFLVSGGDAPEEYQTVQLDPVFTPELTSETVTYTTSSAAIATVNADGLVTAVGAGTATITVTASNQATASTKIHVVAYNPSTTSTVTMVVYSPVEVPDYVRLFLRGNNFSWDGDNTAFMMTQDATNPLKWTYTANFDFEATPSLAKTLEWKVVLGTVDADGVKFVDGWNHEMKKAADNDNLRHFINGGASSTEYTVERWAAIPSDPNGERFDSTVEITLYLAAGEDTDRDIYLVGGPNGWTGGLAEYKLTQDATNANKFTLTFTKNVLEGSSEEFKFSYGSWFWEIWVNGDDTSNQKVNYTEGTVKLTFENCVWNNVTNEPEFTPGGEVDPDADAFNCTIEITVYLASETTTDIYICGTLNNWTEGGEDYKLVQDSEDPLKYTITLTFEDVTEAGFLEFKFNQGNWANELVLTGGSQPKVFFTDGTVTKEYTNCTWKNPDEGAVEEDPDLVSFTLNITLTFAQAHSKDVYFVGGLSGWSAKAKFKLVQDSTDPLTYTLVITVKAYEGETEFKFYDGDWGAGREVILGEAGSGNQKVEVVADGTETLVYTNCTWN